MPKFGEKSQRVYDSLHTDLQTVLSEAIKHVDFSLTEGHRSNERQTALLVAGRTKAGPGESPHNVYPSNAFDFIPYPFSGWEDAAGFAHIAGIIRGIGLGMGIKLRWGGDWDGDGQLVPRDPDERFNDMPHVERIA